MTKEHKLGSMIVNLNKEVIISFFNEMTKDFRTLESLYSDLEDFINGAIDEDECLESLDNMHLVSVASFGRLSKLHICSNNSVNIYFGRTSAVFMELADMLKNITFTYCAPSREEAEQLKDLTYRTLSGFCFVFGNDFGCFDTVLSAKTSDICIDEIMYHHFSKFAMAPEQKIKLSVDFAMHVAEMSEKFRIHLDVFDAAPEKEKQFLDTVGPDIGAIDESELTMELVDAVLDGSLTVEQLIAVCRYSEFDEEVEEMPHKIEV